jgi:hypothetical protein
MLDFTSFGLGFLVAPVVYVMAGAAVYGAYCSAKWMASSLRHSRTA